MDKIISLDYLISNFFRNLIPHNLFFNNFFSFFSLKGSFIFIWLLVMLIVLILEERKNPGITKQDKKFVIIFSASFLLTFFLADFVLKNIFMRSRPFSSGFICPTDFSFPSAHAATAFAAATVLTYFDKKRRWFYCIVAILISYSRIYLGCHYFFDVIAGVAIGLIISQLLLFVHGTFPFRRKN
ncbi:MAG: phosphatase PAP2 family protein [Patescibacteria group bacterium]